MIHDVCLQNLPVIFCLDRAGIVGEDGATHHGVFDLASLRPIPNLIICAPRDAKALRNIMYTAQLGLNNPIAIRYPRGHGKINDWKTSFELMAIGVAETLKHGNQIAVLSIGTMADKVSSAIASITDSSIVSHIDMQFLKPLDETLLHELCRTHRAIITIEDGNLNGGLGSAVAEFITTNN